jgi:hypothetical protein
MDSTAAARAATTTSAIPVRQQQCAADQRQNHWRGHASPTPSSGRNWYVPARPGGRRESEAAVPRMLPPLPEIGHPESYYAKQVHRADKRADVHAHEAYKVGQYITLGKNPYLSWPEKLKYFRHALARHCNPPPYPDDEIWMFYRSLADLVRQHSGEEALRIISAEDDTYAKRMKLGQVREAVEDEAEAFFKKFIPTEACPDWFNQEDYEAMKIIRNQWI